MFELAEGFYYSVRTNQYLSQINKLSSEVVKRSHEPPQRSSEQHWLKQVYYYSPVSQSLWNWRREQSKFSWRRCSIVSCRRKSSWLLLGFLVRCYSLAYIQDMLIYSGANHGAQMALPLLQLACSNLTPPKHQITSRFVDG